MRTKILLLFLLGWAGMAFGQDDYEKSTFDLSFETDTIKFSKTGKDEYISIPLKMRIVDVESWEDYKLVLEVDENSTLPYSDYEFKDNNFSFNNLKNGKVLSVKLKKDNTPDRDRILILNLKTFKNKKNIEDRNIGSIKKVVIIISDGKDHINLFNEYNILAYLGTNFDIVESKTKAKNLFFATNIFIPPVERKNKIGFYFSLYGNRTMSDIDSTGNVNRVYKIEKLTDSTHIKYSSQNRLVITRVSDNIGGFISPLIKLFKSSNKHLSLYYSPSLEFIWRKVDITTEFKNPSNLNSTIVNGTIPGTIVMDNISRKIQNEYTFNFGAAGLFLAYQTSAVSFRVHASVGYSSHFYPSNSLLQDMDDVSVGRKHDIFFLGRAWLTEAKTGVTLQTEIMNTAIHPRPFFGVTLSKAFRLEEIGIIFNPLSDRKK